MDECTELFNYDYWTELIEAIEKYSSNELLLNPIFFRYDGHDFIAAFERHMYFHLLGNKNYRNKIKSNLICGGDVLTTNMWERKILSYLNLTKNINFCVKEQSIQDTPRIKVINQALPNYFLEGETSYVFVVIHHKFIRYFSEIYKKLKNSIFVICGDIEASLELCQAEGYKHILFKNTLKADIDWNSPIRQLADIYENASHLLRVLEPRAIILPEGNAPTCEVFNLASNKIGIQSICIQQGWAPIVHNGFRKMHYDLFLTWGEKFSESLEPYNPDQKFVNTGSHVLNINPNVSEKKVIQVSIFLQPVCYCISQDGFDLFLKLVCRLSDHYKELYFLVREHPSHPLNEDQRNRFLRDNLMFANPDKYTLAEVLSSSTIAISIFSTVLYEAMFYDVIPFSFNISCVPKMNPSLEENKIGFETSNFDEALEQFDILIRSTEKRDEYIENIRKHKRSYFSTNGDNALNNIIDTITGVK